MKYFIFAQSKTGPHVKLSVSFMIDAVVILVIVSDLVQGPPLSILSPKLILTFVTDSGLGTKGTTFQPSLVQNGRRD